TSDDVIGIETAVQDGTVTDQAHGIVTHREGKTEALLHATGGRRPFFCAGNTMGDLELLECSTDLKLAVSAASRDDRLFKTEDELQKLAEERGWLHHRFIVGG
ncbi:MAG TPA: haloacid dehalogenase, partial [Pseudobdellovibrionaceae bacterium]|nr:haloacid dehalogenase [Pseudobdellovibrionaceae bacterium]